MSLWRLVTRATFTPGAELELVPSDRRADGHPDEPRLDAMRSERRLEHPAGLLDQPLVDLLRGAPCEQVERRELPRSLRGRRTERDLELLDDDLFGLAVVVGFLVVERDVELVLGVLSVVLAVFVLLLLVGVVDHRDRLGRLLRLAYVDHRAIADTESLSRERRNRTDDTSRRRVHRSHSARGAGRERLERRSGEDEHTGQANTAQHERGARSGEHPLHGERGRRAENAPGVAELVERGVPLTGAEGQLEETGRGDREQREPQGQADALGGCPTPDERDADEHQRERHGEPHPSDEEADALAQGGSNHAGPVRVDPETGDDRHDEAGEAGKVTLVARDRLPPSTRSGAGARPLRPGGSGRPARRRLLAGDHSNHNRNSSNTSNMGVAESTIGNDAHTTVKGIS